MKEAAQACAKLGRVGHHHLLEATGRDMYLDGHAERVLVATSRSSTCVPGCGPAP